MADFSTAPCRHCGDVLWHHSGTDHCDNNTGSRYAPNRGSHDRTATQPPPTQNASEPPWPDMPRPEAKPVTCGGCVALQAMLGAAGDSLGAELMAANGGIHYHAIDELRARIRDLEAEVNRLAIKATTAECHEYFGSTRGQTGYDRADVLLKQNRAQRSKIADLHDALDEIDSLATVETAAVVAIARRALGRGEV